MDDLLCLLAETLARSSVSWAVKEEVLGCLGCIRRAVLAVVILREGFPMEVGIELAVAEPEAEYRCFDVSMFLHFSQEIEGGRGFVSELETVGGFGVQ